MKEKKDIYEPMQALVVKFPREDAITTSCGVGIDLEDDLFASHPGK